MTISLCIGLTGCRGLLVGLLPRWGVVVPRPATRGASPEGVWGPDDIVRGDSQGTGVAPGRGGSLRLFTCRPGLDISKRRLQASYIDISISINHQIYCHAIMVLNVVL